MKNKIRLIDVNIMSMYMGRWMTIISVVIVATLTLTAWYGTRRGQHNIINVCVPDDVSIEVFEPFRVLLARETRRTVVVAAADEATLEGRDLYIMRMVDYFKYQESMDLEAIFEVFDSERRSDEAVLFARSDEAIEVNQLRTGDVAFVSPSSVNGYWAQALMLSDLGLNIRPQREHFVGGGMDATRVVFAVLYGPYRVGACRLSRIADMRERDILRAGELTILEQTEALPETVVAVPRREVNYYRRELAGVQSRFDESAAGGSQSETVRLLKSFGFKGLAPVTAERLARAKRLALAYGEF